MADSRLARYGKNMAAPKRNKLQREQDLSVLTKLYFKKVPQVEIAKQLGISQGQVSQDLKKLVKKWEESNLHQIDRFKAEQLDRINTIEEEMWDAWELSKTTAKKIHTKSKSGKFIKDPLTKSVQPDEGEFWRAGMTEEETRGGDMQYMNGVMWCCQERAKILGLYAPKKVANTDPTGDKEAGVSAREELMGMIGKIADKLAPALAKNVTPQPANGEIIEVESFTADAENSMQVPDPAMPELARLLKDESKRRMLPPAQPMNTTGTPPYMPLPENTREITAVIDVKPVSQKEIRPAQAQADTLRQVEQIVKDSRGEDEVDAMTLARELQNRLKNV